MPSMIKLAIPVTFTQITWFVITEFIIILFADVPPLSMIEGAFLKYLVFPLLSHGLCHRKPLTEKAIQLHQDDGAVCPATQNHLCRKSREPA